MSRAVGILEREVVEFEENEYVEERNCEKNQRRESWRNLSARKV